MTAYQCLQSDSTSYPPSLLNSEFYPKVIYCRGKLSAYQWAREIMVAIVGSRQPTAYGRRVAYHLAFQLARLGIVVVSGLAIGIDSEVHRATLGANGRTIAVLGCGINRCYPVTNYSLQQQILAHQGLVMSEFTGEQRISLPQFRSRNRIIAGLSRAVVVIEGTMRSGTLVTARYGLEAGREILAVPGPIDSPLSAAPHWLLKQGARLLTSYQDVLEAIGFVEV